MAAAAHARSSVARIAAARDSVVGFLKRGFVGRGGVVDSDMSPVGVCVGVVLVLVGWIEGGGKGRGVGTFHMYTLSLGVNER